MCDVLAVHTASESEFVVEGEVKVDVVIISYFICFYHDLPPFILDRAHNLGFQLWAGYVCISGSLFIATSTSYWY